MTYFHEKVAGLVLGRVEDAVGVAGDHREPGPGSRPVQQQDDQVAEAGEEGHAPDEADQAVGATHGAQLGVA